MPLDTFDSDVAEVLSKANPHGYNQYTGPGGSSVKLAAGAKIDRAKFEGHLAHELKSKSGSVVVGSHMEGAGGQRPVTLSGGGSIPYKVSVPADYGDYAGSSTHAAKQSKVNEALGRMGVKTNTHGQLTHALSGHLKK